LPISNWARSRGVYLKLYAQFLIFPTGNWKNFLMNGNLRILSAMVIVIWINFLETIAFLRVEFSRIWFEKCLEILKIFSKNSNSWYIVCNEKNFRNEFNTDSPWNGSKFKMGIKNILINVNDVFKCQFSFNFKFIPKKLRNWAWTNVKS
jgi:hypothetical protein